MDWQKVLDGPIKLYSWCRYEKSAGIGVGFATFKDFRNFFSWAPVVLWTLFNIVSFLRTYKHTYDILALITF